MLIVFFGTDTTKVRAEAFSYAAKAEQKGAETLRLSAAECSRALIEDAAGGASLFGTLRLYVIDTPSEDADVFAYIFDHLDLLAESPNTFVLIEGGLLAGPKKVIQKYAAEVYEYAGVKEERFNVFQLTESLLRRDKKSLWMLLLRAREEGISEEELIGTLFWQLKTVRLALVTRSADEAGLKPFVYSKAKGMLQKYTEAEINAKTRELVTLYHEGHSGTRDIDLALERWVLSI